MSEPEYFRQFVGKRIAIKHPQFRVADYAYFDMVDDTVVPELKIGTVYSIDRHPEKPTRTEGIFRMDEKGFWLEGE